MERKFKNIYLIGPMGSGKSTTGKCLAKLAKYEFYDVDQSIVDTTGVEISWIFEREGEAGFRAREQETIRKLSELEHCVLATGGGCVVAKANRDVLKSNGFVVYLTVSIDTQITRISHKKNQRPLFTNNDSRDKLAELNLAREPLYQEIADIQVNTDKSTPEQLANEILAAHKKFAKKGNHK